LTGKVCGEDGRGSDGRRSVVRLGVEEVELHERAVPLVATTVNQRLAVRASG
jgi:hypothetical protein